MSAVNTQISGVLDGFVGELTPIKDCCKKYIKYSNNLGCDNSISIGRNLAIAPEYYLIRLYESAAKKWIDDFQEKNKIFIPETYQNVLLKMNGCFMFDMALFGLPPHIYSGRKPMPFQPQCLGLDTANTAWKKKYKIDDRAFHFGGRLRNHYENIGYFMMGDKIRAILISGKVVNEYCRFDDFLAAEIKLTEDSYFKENKLENMEKI